MSEPQHTFYSMVSKLQMRYLTLLHHKYEVYKEDRPIATDQCLLSIGLYLLNEDGSIQLGPPLTV